MKYMMYKKDELKLLWQTAYIWQGDFNTLHSQTYTTCGKVLVLLRGGSYSTIGTIHTCFIPWASIQHPSGFPSIVQVYHSIDAGRGVMYHLDEWRPDKHLQRLC